MSEQPTPKYAPPLILIGSELAQLAALKSQALAGLDSGIQSYRRRNPNNLDYFGFHTGEVLLLRPRRIQFNLYWHDRMPFQDEEQGLIISVAQQSEFYEVVNAVWMKMQWIRSRQKRFRFPEQRSA